MSGLLTAAAVVAFLMLLASSTNLISRATATDPHKRGTWGVAHLTREQSRPLNPHERRWQTVLLASRNNPSRWNDLVSEIQRLESLGSLSAIGPAPATRDAKWVEASLARLEAAVNESAINESAINESVPNPYEAGDSNG